CARRPEYSYFLYYFDFW
nr:immunoglobulin heavy chain junction region [Macaca mulatta]